MDTSVGDTSGMDFFLPIGTAVSAKFRGAFCEARISVCSPNVKYKILLAKTIETITVDASEIELISAPRGHDRYQSDEVYPVESAIRVLKTNQLGVVKKAVDASSYTIVFDDNDQSTVFRHELKLKGQKHFKDFETLDTKIFSHDDGSSTCGFSIQSLESLRSRSKRHSRNSLNCEIPDSKINFSTSESESNTVEDYYSSATEDEEANSPANVNNWILTHLDQVIWVEKSRGSSFPGLVIDPWETEKKRDAGNHCIIRSFRDNRFYSIPFKYIKPFDQSLQTHKPQLQSAIDVASAYIINNVLPKTWAITYRQIFADIVEFLQDESVPEYVTSGAFSIELGRLFYCVWRLGGFEVVCQMKLWPTVVRGISKANLNWGSTPSPGFIAKMKSDYKKYLAAYQDVFEDRLGANEDNPLPSMEFNATKTDVSFKTEVIRPSSAPSQIPQRRIRCVDDQIEVSYKDGKSYPAKILKIDTSRPIELGIYFVHYKNWNSRHDEWISEDLISASEVTCLATTPSFSGSKSIHEKKEPGELTMSLESPIEHKAVAKRGAASSAGAMYADSVTSNNKGASPSGEKESDFLKESASSEVKAQQSSLSQKIAEKRYKMLQSSASENSEASCNIFKSKARFGQRLSPAAKKEELEQKRNVSISSSDEDTSEKFPVRSPRKLPARRRTPKKAQNVASNAEIVDSFPVEEKSCANIRRKLSDLSEKALESNDISAIGEHSVLNVEQTIGSPSKKRSATSCENKETREETEEKIAEVAPQNYRSPPKRRRVVKRVSDNDKFLQRASGSPVKEEENNLRDHLKVEKEDEQLYEEAVGDTNDEGFSADEECESDDTIDMNKPIALTPPAYEDIPTGGADVASSENTGVTDTNQLNVFNEKYVAKDEYLGELSVSTRTTRSLDIPGAAQRTDTPMFQLPLDDNDSSKREFVGSSCSTKNGKSESVCVESPTGSRTFNKKNKRPVVSSDVGTPLGPKTEPCGTVAGSSKRSAKRNGKSGQYKHGFFISDPEESEIDEFGSSGMGEYLHDQFSRQNSANQNENRCNLNFYTFQNSEDDCEKILDVSVLDEIDDVDERIRVAEQQMNLIRKRYNQVYREMEKLDNLKRRIRKRNKLKQNNADEPSPRIAFQEDSNESPGKNGGELSQDQLSDSVAVTSSVTNCEVSPTSGLDTLSTVTSKLCWAANESLCSSAVGEQNGSSYGIMQQEGSSPRRDEEERRLTESTAAAAPITSTASGINITEDQLNAVESLMSLRSQLS